METHNRELDELYSGTIPDIVEGTILKGKVISIKSDNVVVDIGYKSEGFISIGEFVEKDRGGLCEGSEIEVYVSRIDSDGLVILSPEKARKIRTLQRLEEAQKDGTPVEGIVVERIKGGYNVDISGIRAFMPGSQADLKPLKDPDSLIGQEIELRVLKFNSKLTNVIVSRRVILEEERAKLREKTLANLRPECVLPGVVKNITDYGVFIDLGGIDGLLHISDISWGRIRHPSDVFNVGQEVEVMVLNFAPETEKVTLGYKQKRSDPWLNIEEKYPVGRVVSGKVVSLTDYGAFVELEDGVEGLVHVSELDWSPRPKHPSNYMEIGDFVDAQILKVDPKERRVSLGIKQLKPKPWKLVAERYEVGQRISGRVRSLTEFGAFIGLPEGVDALLHISDMSWTKHVRHPSEVLRKGQMIEAVILSLEPEKERMALGLKQLVPDPWEEKIPADFHLGEEVKCKALRHTEFGIFVELEGEVEGLIYSSEIDTGGKKPEEVYKEGDEIVVRIIKVDVEGRKIGLSLKTLKHETDE